MSGIGIIFFYVHSVYPTSPSTRKLTLSGKLYSAFLLHKYARYTSNIIPQCITTEISLHLYLNNTSSALNVLTAKFDSTQWRRIG